ncbi:MAG: hypothetical protein HND51_14480 [Chloroflexi bacterium]|nr:hypothetical protein [Chloroflexota bacterium]
MSRWKPYFPLLLALLLALALKLILLIADVVPFNSDEAIVALTARHILEGARPIFFYGQAYMGTIDSYMIAVGFSLFGESVLVMRLMQTLIYLLFILSSWILALRLFSSYSIANSAAFLAALPPILVTTYTTPYFGTYGETLVFGNIILLLGFELITRKWQRSLIAWIGLGFIAGFAFWTFSLIVIYLFPIALFGLWKHRQRLWVQYLVTAVGFFIGSSPWWWYNFNYEWVAWTSLVDPLINQASFFHRLIGFFGLGVPALLGMRPPWQPEYYIWPIVLLALVMYLLAILEVRRAWSQNGISVDQDVVRLLFLFFSGFLLFFLGTERGIDSTGRYLLPLFPLLIFLTALFVEIIKKQSSRVALLTLIGFLSLNLSGTWISSQSEDGITTQFDPITSFNNLHDDELIEFLNNNKISHGYTNYWVSYRLAFLSRERLIFSPELPYKLEFLNYKGQVVAIPYYAWLADKSSHSAFITTKHPDLDDFLRDRLFQLEVLYMEEQIGPYHIFYDLSEKVTPEQLGFAN